MFHKSAKKKDRKKNRKPNIRTQKLVSKEENYDSTTCDAVLLTQSEIGDDEETKSNARDALRQTLLDDEFHIENVRGELFVGNHRGLNLAAMAARLRALENDAALEKKKLSALAYDAALEKVKLSALADGAASEKVKLSVIVDDAALEKVKVSALADGAALEKAKREMEMTELKEELVTLRSSLSEYREMRSGFISRFRRDKCKISDSVDTKIIRRRNVIAHEGDAIVDAMLYTPIMERTDENIFAMLYGLTPLQVSRIKYKPAIIVLNLHASTIASPFKAGTERFYELFAKFIELLKGWDYKASYLDEKSGSLANAHTLFLRCVKDEVKMVDN